MHLFKDHKRCFLRLKKVEIKIVRGKRVYKPANAVTAFFVHLACLNPNGFTMTDYTRLLQPVNGLVNLVEVTKDGFIPRNKLASDVLAMIPGASALTLDLLMMLNENGMDIELLL